MFPLRCPVLIPQARDWHNGQWSAMYSLLSTGLVHDVRHLYRLQSEFDEVRVIKPDDTEIAYCCGYLDALAFVNPQD